MIEASVCMQTEASGKAGLFGCLVCALYMIATAFGSFFAGAVFNAGVRQLKLRLAAQGKGSPEVTLVAPAVAPKSRPVGPPPKRRHSIALTGGSDRSALATLAARRNRAIRPSNGESNTMANGFGPPPPSNPAARSGSDDDDVDKDEERDVPSPLTPNAITRSHSAMRQQGRSFAASLRKITLLHDNSVEQVPPPCSPKHETTLQPSAARVAKT